MIRGLRARLVLIGALQFALATEAFPLEPDTYDIPGQQLSTALLKFARTAGVSVGFESATTDNKTSVPLMGDYYTEEALRALLSESGLVYTRYPGDVFRIHEPAAARAADQPEASEDPPSGPRSAVARGPAAPGAIMDEVTAVGSRIRKSRFSEMMPVTVIERDFIESMAVFSAGSVFGYVPSAGINSFNGVDNYFYGVNDARGDVSTANLRGLGSGNSLLLLNGRRVVNHPGTQEVGQVLATTSNFNALPLFAIERMEILLDGASSIYGSDAVSGVINTVVSQDEDRIRLGVQHGVAESTPMGRTAVNLQISRSFLDRGSASLFAEFTRQMQFEAGDRRFSRSADLRDLFTKTRFAGDRDLDNRSLSTPWGQFKLPVGVNANGQPVTTATGLFHIQPGSFDGCLAGLANGLCIDDGMLDDPLRFDSNRYRLLAPELERLNLFSMLNFAVSESAEIYGEAAWYEADSRHTREPSNPLASHPITIPRDNYWNPFGPVNFDDGRANPNRLPGIDAPAEGLPLTINTRSLGGYYRLVDAGARIIEVGNHTDRLLLGVRGTSDDWYFDGAVLYSSARTRDMTRNRVSSTLFQRSLALDTPEAYNPFNGGDPATPTYGDATPNPDDVVAQFLIDVGRVNETSLTLADVYATNSEVFTVGGRPVGMSLGAEWRKERFSERRDPRLNGEIGYTDIVTGIAYASDVMHSSITPDSNGSRQVASFFGELGLSVVDESQDLRYVRSLDINLAMRLEDYSDVGKEWRPRIGLAWWIFPALGVHASWSEGLRAPNLPQVNATPVPRIQVARDWYRCQALINKGLIATLGACEFEAQRTVEVITSGSNSLVAETNQSWSAGLRFRWQDAGLQASLDYWQIDQSDVVGLFGVQNHVALDYLRRLDGTLNPAVTRAALRPEDILFFEGSGLEPVGALQSVDERYQNLDGRLTRGIDLQVNGEQLDTWLGAFTFDVTLSRLLTSRQSVPTLGQEIVEAGEPALQFVGAGNLLERNGRPRWRASFRLAFERGDSRFGLFGRYTSGLVDTSAIQDQTDEFLPVDNWRSVSAFAGLRMPLATGIDATLRLTVDNIFDEAPPLADEALGYFVGLHDAVGRSYNLSLVADLR